MDNWFGEVYYDFRALCSPCWWPSPSPALFVRRFVVRPQWLGELSQESGIIALLISC